MIKKITPLLLALLLFTPLADAAQISRQHVFKAGYPLQSIQLEDEFNNAVTGVNANDTAIQSLLVKFTSDNLNVTSGGTGASTASAARTNLGAAASGANSDITSLTGLTTPLSVSQGGTGLSSLTAGTLLYSNASNSVGALTLGSSLAITSGSLGQVADTTNQRVAVGLAGSTVGTRKTINFIQGSNVTLTVADNGASNRVDVTIAGSNVSNLGAPGANIIILEDQKASGTAGGSSVATTWTARTLNTKVVDTGSICTLTSNQFTLPAGTYRVYASAPAFQSAAHQIRLRNVTDGTTALVGTISYNNNANNAQTDSIINGRFTIAGTKTFEIDHYITSSLATSGLGIALSSGETSVFTRVVIMQEN